MKTYRIRSGRTIFTIEIPESENISDVLEEMGITNFEIIE